jgi:hypothetical protein
MDGRDTTSGRREEGGRDDYLLLFLALDTARPMSPISIPFASVNDSRREASTYRRQVAGTPHESGDGGGRAAELRDGLRFGQRIRFPRELRVFGTYTLE